LKAIGIVFLYNRNLGNPNEISKKFSKFFPSVIENLITKKLINLMELKEIMDLKKIFWGGIKERFSDITENEEAIGTLAWKIFYDHTGKEASELVESLTYDGSHSPWNFPLIVCVLYKKNNSM